MTMSSEDTHRIYHNSKGEVVPSVTTISGLYPKDLTKWANYMGFKRQDVTQILNERANYGKYVHALFEKYFTDKDIFESSKGIDPWLIQLHQKFEYIKDTLYRQGYVAVKTEFPIDGEKFGGTLDILFYNESNNKYLLLDLKTSKSVYDSMRVQLAGYCMLLEEKYDIHVDVIGIILIERDIDDPWFTNIWKREDNLNQEKIFMHLLDIYYLMNAQKG